jgi:HEAT repeat protein
VRETALQSLHWIEAAPRFAVARRLVAEGPQDLWDTAMAILDADGTPETRRLLRSTAAGPHPARALRALVSLAKQADLEARPGLRRLLSRGNGSQRSTAASVRPLLGDAEALTDLLPLLGDPNDGVRQAAIRAVGTLRPPQPPPRLLEALDDPSPDARAAALEAIAATRWKGAAPAAARLLQDPELEVRLAAVQALYALDPESGKRALLEHLDDPGSVLRYALLDAAAGSGDSDLQARVLRCLGEPEPVAAAIVAAGTHRLPGAVGPLLRHLDTDDPAILLQTVQALEQLGDPAAIPALRKALADHDVLWTRRSIATALALCGDGSGVPYLLRGRPDFPVLNAVRRPELWRRLRGLRSTARPDGDLHEELRRLAKEAGLELEMSPSAAAIAIRRNPGSVGSREWTSALSELCGIDLVPVLEEGRLRILARPEGRAFWRAWGEAESKRLGER